MIGGLIGALALVLFVFIHEAGHFLAAKATGMKATEFFFGFGPRLWSTHRGETEYGFKALPLGGYVRIIGMNPFEEVAPEDAGRTYREKPFWKKSVVVLAGVGMNFLLAFVMFFGVIMYEGVDEPVPVVDNVIATVGDGETAASAAGLRAGDRIVGIDGERYDEWGPIAESLSSRPGEELVLTIERGSEIIEVPVTMGSNVNPETGQEEGFLGITLTVDERSAGLFEAAGIAGRQVWTYTGLTFQVLGQLVQPESLAQLAGVFVGDTEVPAEIRPVSPIGMANIGSQVDTFGITNYILLLASINVILATFNVLPVLPLDGGHFAIALWQKITGREPDIRKLVPVAVAVMALFVFLFLSAVILDVVNPIQL